MQLHDIVTFFRTLFSDCVLKLGFENEDSRGYNTCKNSSKIAEEDSSMEEEQEDDFCNRPKLLYMLDREKLNYRQNARSSSAALSSDSVQGTQKCCNRYPRMNFHFLITIV